MKARYPLPHGIGPGYRVGGASSCLATLAGKIADKAWRGRGVRAFVLPDLSLVVVPVQSREDEIMMRRHRRFLLATWCLGKTQQGPSFHAILDELRSVLGEGKPA